MNINLAYQEETREKLFWLKTCESFCDGVDVYLTEEDMTEKEKKFCKTIVPVSLYDDFSIPLEEIFYNLI